MPKVEIVTDETGEAARILADGVQVARVEHRKVGRTTAMFIVGDGYELGEYHSWVGLACGFMEHIGALSWTQPSEENIRA